MPRPATISDRVATMGWTPMNATIEPLSTPTTSAGDGSAISAAGMNP